MLLSVSAKIRRVNDMIELICRLQTNDRPIMFVLLTPMFITVDITPKYPAAATVKTENKSVTKLIHLDVMF